MWALMIMWFMLLVPSSSCEFCRFSQCASAIMRFEVFPCFLNCIVSTRYVFKRLSLDIPSVGSLCFSGKFRSMETISRM